MVRLKLAGVLLSLAALPAALAAQTQLTLQQAVATALEKNPERKAAMFHRQAAATGIQQARAALLPKITFHEGYTRSNDPVFVFGSKLQQQRFSAADFALNVLNTPTPLGNFSTRFSGGWQLFDSGASWLRVSQAKQVSSLAQKRLERTDQQLVYGVIDAYMGLLLADKNLEVAQGAVKTLQAVFERSNSRYQAGMVVESDVLSAKVDLAARRQELIAAENAVKIARAELNRELGVPLDTGYQAAEVLGERVFPTKSATNLEKLALEHRPDLQAATLRRDIQRKSETMAKADFGPRLNAFADWETDTPRLAGGGGNNWTAGVELQLDLFSGGAKIARLRNERALAEEASAMRESMVSAVRVQVRKAYYDFDSARQQVDVARAAVEESKESLRITQNRYDGGLITITDLLRTEEASRRAETDYWQAVYRLNTNYANLELATGTLDANSPVVKP